MIKILICGLPGSGKTTLAEPLSRELDAIWINADKVRTRFQDWDFSEEGRTRQAGRMRNIADGVVMAGKIAVADFICPTEETRKDFDADYTIWMDTIQTGRYDDTNALFEPPTNYNYRVTDWTDDTQPILEDMIKKYIELPWINHG
jgi:adenylylsulfate kinase